MRYTTEISRVFLVSLALALAVLAFHPTYAEPPAEIFTGFYDWRSGGRDDLSVEFRPDGEGRWLVTFRFGFDGDDYTWRGAAEGSLADGASLTGTATSKSRKWTWSATIEDGVMTGRHKELKSRGRTYDTGTFEIER